MSGSPPVNVAVKRFAHARDLPLPAYATAGAAGLDLMAALPENAAKSIAPGERALIPTGLAIALPPDHEAQVRPRSGLALKHGLTVLNAPGTIDADYRGEIQVVLINLGDKPVSIERGMRIAQLVVTPVARAVLVESADLDGTERAGQGFGSTGVR